MTSDFSILKDLIQIDSPTGFTRQACEYCSDYLTKLGLKPEYTNKGAVRCALGTEPVLAIAAHVDTLGAIVEEIQDNGTLRVSMIGSYPPNSFEGCYVRVHTLNGRIYSGTLLLDNPSSHANREISETKRTLRNMHVRLDEKFTSASEVQESGISVGDFVCYEPHYQELESGFIKSRFLDNKSGCYVLFEIAKNICKTGQEYPVELYFSNYEEVGHGGASGYSSSIRELLVIDMGVVGEGVSGSETAVSICAKDSSGPYDYDMRKKLQLLAKEHCIPYKTSIYPFYGSDGSAALRAGCDYRVALIGPGVSASHGVERTHKDGIAATVNLSLSYINQYLKSRE